LKQEKNVIVRIQSLENKKFNGWRELFKNICLQNGGPGGAGRGKQQRQM
jgi:hypothetical protein